MSSLGTLQKGVLTTLITCSSLMPELTFDVPGLLAVVTLPLVVGPSPLSSTEVPALSSLTRAASAND